MEPYLGEIQIFAFNFAPEGWAICDGRALPIAQQTALYSLLQARFGGNDTTTFYLPNLAGRLVGGAGAGPGRTSRTSGQAYGSNDVALSVAEMPAHSHDLTALLGRAVPRSATPADGNGLGAYVGATAYATDGSTVAMRAEAISTVGTGTPHTNVQPVLAMNPCIALQGTYPQRP